MREFTINLIYIQSILASLFLIVALIYGIFRLAIKNKHFAQWLFDYMRNRKGYQEYKEWLKEDKDAEGN